MKLNELCENFYADQERDHMIGLVQDYLERGQHFSPRVEQVVAGLGDDQFQKLAAALLPAAEDSYDYATDTGAEINIREEDVVAALRQMRMM